MRRVLMDGQSVKDIYRNLKQAVHFFEMAQKEMKHIDIGSNGDDIDRTVRPHDHYRVVLGERRLFIHLYRDFYSLECVGFKPRNLELRYFRSDIELHRFLYGKFSDFGDCLNAFYEILHDLTQFHCMELF